MQSERRSSQPFKHVNTVVWAMLLLIILHTLALVFFYAVVDLNLVFTHDGLEVSDVPYYDSHSGAHHPTLLQVQRYHFEWWVSASDSMRIIQPIFTITFMFFQLAQGPFTMIPYQVLMGTILTVDVAKVIYRAVEWSQCGFYQTCRNFDVSGTPSDANYVFLTMFWFYFSFMLLDAVYLWTAPLLKRVTENFKDFVIGYKTLSTRA